MERSEIFLPMFILQLVAMRIKHFMQQHIAPIASLHHFVRGRSVAGDHDLPIASLELISIGFLPYPMPNRKRSDRNVLVAIHHSWLYLVHINLVSRGVSLLQSPPPNPHIFRPSFLDVRSHILQPMRTVSLQRLFRSE